MTAELSTATQVPSPCPDTHAPVWSPRLAFVERDVSGLVQSFLAGCAVSEYTEVDGGLIFEMKKWIEGK